MEAVWRPLNAVQNEFRAVESPLPFGSSSAAWTWPSSVEEVLLPPVCEFWLRYELSRNWSRTRLIVVMSTPWPSCEPAPVTLDRLWIVSGLRSVRFTCWRV